MLTNRIPSTHKQVDLPAFLLPNKYRRGRRSDHRPYRGLLSERLIRSLHGLARQWLTIHKRRLVHHLCLLVPFLNGFLVNTYLVNSRKGDWTINGAAVGSCGRAGMIRDEERFKEPRVTLERKIICSIAVKGTGAL
jgi:hypothetical protein